MADGICGSCGDRAPYTITLHGRPMPACLRHLNVWRTPAPDYTCPTACVEQNHPGREHHDWLTGQAAPDSAPTVREAGDEGIAAVLVRTMQPAMGDDCSMDELRAYAALLVPLIAELQAQAWEEGFVHQYQYTSAAQENPYRSGGEPIVARLISAVNLGMESIPRERLASDIQPDDPDRGVRLYVETLRQMNPSREVVAVLDEIESALAPETPEGTS